MTHFLAYEIRESVLMTEGIDGYFGLSPSYRNATLSLPDQLYEQGSISENKFTIWINNDAANIQSASITFGGMPEGATLGETFSMSINTAKSQWWTVSYKGLLYGSDNIYGSNIKYAIIDSGTMYINLGNQDFTNFKTKIQAAPGGDLWNCPDSNPCFSNVTTCAEFAPNMEPLEIILGNIHAVIPPEGYLISNPNYVVDGPEPLCTCAVYKVRDTEKIVLGDAFMRNFVVTFDNQNNEVSLTINKLAVEGLQIYHKFTTG